MTRDEAYEQFVRPLELSAQRLFATPDGAKLLDACERAFADPAYMIEKDKEGRIDPYAMAVHVGAAQVINYLRKLAEPKEQHK